MSVLQLSPTPTATPAVPAIAGSTDTKPDEDQKLLDEKMQVSDSPPILSPRSTSLQSPHPVASPGSSPTATPQKPAKNFKKFKVVLTSLFKCGYCGSEHREVPVRDSVHPHPRSPISPTVAVQQDASTVPSSSVAAVPDTESVDAEPSASALASIVTQVAQGQAPPTISTDDDDTAASQQEVPQTGQSTPSGTRALLTPLAPEDVGKKCLVLDLDETLVHSSFKAIPHPDFIVPVDIDGQIHHAYVLKRPGVDTFLQRLGPQFEMVVFTASVAKYADPVLDILDTHKVIKHRLFRDACIMYRGNYVKDLSQLGRDIKEVIIIDNSPASYVFHPTNAIPITTWFNDPTDTELLDLIPFLEDLKVVDNVMLVLDNNGFDDQ